VEDKEYGKLWHQLAEVYSSSSILITETESNELYSSLLKTYSTYSDIQPHTTTPTAVTQTKSNTMEYFSKKGHSFLQYCCDCKLELYSFQVNDEYGQIITYDIKFGYLGNNKSPAILDPFRITFQISGPTNYGGGYDYEYVDSNYSDSIELPNKLKYIMRAVYAHIAVKQLSTT
jgi:hypothetical protein